MASWAKAIIIVFTCLPFLSLHAINFNVFGNSNGMPDNTVKCITQDEMGFLWLGTFHGLCRYDGESFVTFKHRSNDALSLPFDHVEAIMAVRGGLWVGTIHGLVFYSFKNGVFHRAAIYDIDRKRISSDISVRSILLAGQKVFMVTNSGRLYVKRGKLSFEPYFPMRNQRVLSAAPFNGRFLIVQTPRYVEIFDAESNCAVSRYNMLALNTNGSVMYFSQSSKRLYIGYGIGFPSSSFTIGKHFEIKESGDDVPSNLKSAIDYHGRTVFATDGGGLCLRNGKSYKAYTPLNSNISSDAIHSLFADRQGNLWIGTYRGGLDLYSPSYNTFNILSLKNGMLTHGVVSAVHSWRGRLYVGLDGGGLNVLGPGFVRTAAYTSANSNLPDDNVLSISNGSDCLWLGVYGKGLCRFSPESGSFTTYSLAKSLGKIEYDNVWNICYDGHGNVWIITWRNVVVFNENSRHFKKMKGLEDKMASNLMCDGTSMWVSASDGIYKIDCRTKRITAHYTKGSKAFPLPVKGASYIYADRQRHFWFFGTDNVLYRMNRMEGKAVKWDLGRELGVDDVSGIRQGSGQSFYVSTDKGLFQLDGSTGRYWRISPGGNYPVTQFNHDACASFGNTLLFGGVGGLLWFDVANKLNMPREPRVFFTYADLPVSGTIARLMYGAEGNQLRLSSQDNFFTIQFTTPELASLNSVYFSYKLEGFDKGWSRPSTSRKASYTNVPPGRYRFVVRASNGVSDTGFSEACIDVVVDSPWHSTVWARCLWAFLLASALYLAFRFYRHEEDVKRTIAMKEAERDNAYSVSEAKLNFFANITHELRTPIFLITAPIEELLGKGYGTVSVPRSYLKSMHRSAMRLNRLVSRVIDLRKLEMGKLSIKKQRRNVVEFCQSLVPDFEDLCQKKNICFSFNASIRFLLLDFDPEKLDLVISNLVTNAFKYTPDGGAISLNIDDNGQTVRIHVKDNGVGIDKIYHKAIFESYFQVDPSNPSVSGDGMGLAFVKHIVKLHGGTVAVESGVGQGSDFILELPKPLGNARPAPCSPVIETPCEVESMDGSAVGNAEPRQTPSPIAVRTMLVIDDEPEALDVVSRFFMSDFKVVKASDGAEGIEAARKSLPDIVICDLMMPRMDGREFLKSLKADKRLSHIPVVVLTALSSENDKLSVFQCGADACLTKPVGLQYLRTRVEGLLKRSEEAAASDLTAVAGKNYTKKEQQFLLACKEIIDDNLARPGFDVSSLAEKLCISHSSLYRKIKSITGLSVIDFMNEYRVYHAIRLFREGEDNINVVCEKCGFNDVKNFRNAFKRKTGLSPKQYVMKLRG